MVGCGAPHGSVCRGRGPYPERGLVALVLIALGVQVPDRFYATAELGVALMLLVLGVGSIVAESRRHRSSQGRPHRLAHDQMAHHHHVAVGSGFKAQLRALGFGVLHGLAGSGAVIVLIIAAAPSARDRTFYLLAFGVGTVAGMSLVSALSGATTSVVGRRHATAVHYLRLGAAMLSVVVGLMLGGGVIRSGDRFRSHPLDAGIDDPESRALGIFL